MGEKRTNLGSAHVFGVSFIVKHDAAPGPANIGFLGAVAQVFQADDVAHLIEQFAFGLDGTRGDMWCHGRSSQTAAGFLQKCRCTFVQALNVPHVAVLCNREARSTACCRNVLLCQTLDGRWP